MTTEELNEYLISIGGLKNGFYFDKPNIVNCDYFECGPGWNKLIKDLIKDLLILGWNKELCQVKEKFGGLRFYINSGSDEIFKRISEAENLSYKTCETCGQVGELRTDIGWYTTLCDNHHQEVLDNRLKSKNS